MSAAEIAMLIIIAFMWVVLTLAMRRVGEIATERDLAQRQLIIANRNIETMRPQVDELNRLKAGALLIEQVREQQARKGKKR